MEGCCAVEREVDRVLTKFNTTQQVGMVEEKDFFMLLKQNIWQKILREGCKKSKWKFKMAFAMKGGGSRGGLVCH